ncbi:MAG: helix-hairpin-helix domain-containing protein [Candidatus Chisholmbacteria bacterium]|nr:helix-hairpin-helix domain-containing protein [Candidatus Chisholmbacteria bacterium]
MTSETFSFDDVSEKKPKSWREIIGNPWQAGLLVLGVVLLVGGGVAMLIGGRQATSPVEIISSDEGINSSNGIVVDVSGAVERPGVYNLDSGARLTDALTAAGGFSEAADRVWVSRYVNLAQVVPDGAKVYIPSEGESYNTGSTSSKSSTGSTGSTGITMGGVLGVESGEAGLVSVNSASQAELEELVGIGEKRAEAIINNRPYSSVEEVKEKAGIPQRVFEEIRNQLTL